MRGQSVKWGMGVLVALVTLGGAVTWAGQSSGKPAVDASMTELVAEVRALRLAVERSGVVAAQAQLLLGRLQLQENRLANLGRTAQDARERAMSALDARNDLARQLAGMTERIEQVSSADERQQMQTAMSELKLRLKDFQARAEQLRADEAAAASAVADEQTRWSEFNSRLETLERALAASATRP